MASPTVNVSRKPRKIWISRGERNGIGGSRTRKREFMPLQWTRDGIMNINRLRRRGAHHQVVRYSALIGGIFYGLLHQGTLQRKHDEDKVCLYSSSKSDADPVFFINLCLNHEHFISSSPYDSNESIPSPCSQSPIYPMNTRTLHITGRTQDL
jgi:hypothetical protein